jgi:hypothetical protein
MKFIDWLQIIFIVAKLFGVINWSWWVVFIPLEIVFAVCLLEEFFN